MKILITILVTLLLGSAVGYATLDMWQPVPKGGVTVGNEYKSTSTIHTSVIDSRLIRRGWGQLGSVVVTGVGTSAFSLYDATSTNFSTNDKKSTSTDLLVTIPASTVAGTYVFDLEYSDGLFIYYDVIGTAPTTTITYR